MLTRVRSRIKLAGLVGGLFAIAVRFMGVSGYVLGVRVVRGGGELHGLIWLMWDKRR